MELKELKVEMDASTCKDNETQLKETQEKSMHCTSNCEDHSFYVEESSEDHLDGDASIRKEVLEVDIEGCTDLNDDKLELSECNDGTEGYSSSFSGTGSESENGTALNDQEADSLMYTNTTLPLWVRKKRLTDHWRRFIQPIMWRCKWLELRMKELQSRAQKYDKELEVYYQAKQFELESLKSEGLASKELLLSCHTKTNGVVKRKKRKRVEETTESSSYMLSHNLFSYHEYRKSSADGALLNDNFCNSDNRAKNAKNVRVFNEESPFLELREGDEYLEQILLKIEAAKSEARNLKNRVDKMLSEFPGRFSSANSLVFPGSADALTSSDQKPQLFLENEDGKPINSMSVSSRHIMPEDSTRDSLMSENAAVSSQGEEKTFPDKKPLNTEQTSIEGPSRSARKRTPRNREAIEGTRQRPRISKEKPKTNVMASRFKVPKRKRKRGKSRSASSGIRRRS
ncbi:PREDICTED: uncharacterized protein LOC104807615 [Tarenaya hassleriana]|uniref:uncharacterized protein LOC104807615 n=1 Tax=Tarenaya hassleriana TaxID=28532 RepID=UPI00053C97E6|nr:PREDICTED: uncharacterized protein LOC104807615 [Tarenaya hassleriana]XP_010531280.1 PREDICTED: uncharacterized protein LOC104807615 [Tarenaya hassleriana]XP_010531281.1 PREDICTED: uncharacterized protein LOC104807615 [Tarenaya hassleriana]XP_010531282.1 PREDICTED: uncharacterized protein LOC104807615 [Tarenaya hassleriana]